MAEEEKIVITVRISPRIWKMAKKFALERDLKLYELVEMALIHELQGKTFLPDEAAKE